jgi:hypothetical protein
MCTSKYPITSDGSFECEDETDVTAFTSAFYDGEAAGGQWE